ncbi:MAG: Tat pathway signal protein [Candidatus Latescibacterota bacterium]
MDDNGRRQFLKRATMAMAAAGSLGVASAAVPAGGRGSATRPVLYRETEAWRKYYRSLM